MTLLVSFLIIMDFYCCFKMKKQLDIEEKQLLQSVENGEWEKIPNQEILLAEYKKIAKTTLLKKHKISISVSENDFMFLQRKSIDTGISTEMLVRSLIHNYSIGKVKLQQPLTHPQSKRK